MVGVGGGGGAELLTWVKQEKKPAIASCSNVRDQSRLLLYMCSLRLHSFIWPVL